MNSGFNNFNNINNNKLIEPNNVYNLIKFSTYVERLKREFQQNCNLIYQDINSGEYTSCILIIDLHKNLAKEDISRINFKIEELKNLLDILKPGLTELLSVNNIYISYKLQKTMKVLAWVMAIATIPIFCTTNWNEIWFKIYNYANHVLQFFMVKFGF